MSFVPSVFGLVAAWLLWSYSRLQNAHDQIREGWNGIVARSRSRRALVPALVRCVEGHQPIEHGLLEALMHESRLSIDKMGTRETCRAEKLLVRDLGRLVGLVTRYPSLKADAQFCDLMAKLVNIEDQIRVSRRYYNTAVHLLNSSIDSFPGKVIANLFFILKAEPIEVGTASESLPQVVGDALRARHRFLIDNEQGECPA